MRPLPITLAGCTFLSKRIYAHGLTAELVKTNYGQAWALSSPDNGPEGFARQQPDGTWDQYADIWALKRARPISHGWKRLTNLMEAIAQTNTNMRRLQVEWAAKGRIDNSNRKEPTMPYKDQAQTAAYKIHSESSWQMRLLAKHLPAHSEEREAIEHAAVIIDRVRTNRSAEADTHHAFAQQEAA